MIADSPEGVRDGSVQGPRGFPRGPFSWRPARPGGYFFLDLESVAAAVRLADPLVPVTVNG